MSWSPTTALGKADEVTRARVLTIAEPIAVDTGVSVQAMLGRVRRARITAARHKLWAALYLAKFSHPEIAELVGCDHSTIIAGVTKALGRDVYKAEVRMRRGSPVAVAS